MERFNGLGMSLGNLSRLSKAKTRSISAENPTGEKGHGAMAEPGPERGPGDLLDDHGVGQEPDSEDLLGRTGAAFRGVSVAGFLRRSLVV